MRIFLVRCLIASLVLTPLFAEPPTSNANQAEAEKAKQERETKALALLEEIITEAQSLRLPENRAYVQVTAADLLWTKDEARARALFQEAAAALTQMMSGVESDDPSYYNRMQFPSQLRQQMLQIVMRRDAQLALDILRATRPPNPPDQDRNAYNAEAQQESQLAALAAQSDPKRAVQIAEESLEKGYSHGVLDTISQLQNKDPEAAKSLASKLVNKLKGEDLTKNLQASAIASSVLFLMNQPPNPKAEGASKQSLFSEQDKKEFIETIVAVTLKGYDISAEGGAHQLGYVLQQMMPLVEKYAPSQMPALRRKLPASQAPAPSLIPNKAYEEFQQLQQKGTVEQLLAFAKTSAPELSTQAYVQAISIAINQGELERARAIVNTQVPPGQRHNIQVSLELTLLSRAAMEGELEKSRRELARIQPPERRVTFWLEMVNIVMRKGDKKTALQLLQETKAMIGDRPHSANQFSTYLQLASSLAQFAPEQGFELLEPLVPQLNSLIAASEVLDEFEQRNGFQNGEMRLQNYGNWTVPRLLQQFAATLAVVASSEFDRSQTIIARFERNEIRLSARLSLVQRMLRSEPDSGEFRRARGGRVVAAPTLPPPAFRRNDD